MSVGIELPQNEISHDRLSLSDLIIHTQHSQLAV